MARINVLHILSTLQFGGAEKQVITLLKHIDSEKYRIILCCLHTGGPLEKELMDYNIDVVFLGMRRRYFFIAFYKLVALMRREKIHIVHTHLYSGHFWGRIAAIIAGVPVIVTTEHGRGLWKKARHLLFERMANRYTDMRIAVSDDVRQIRVQRECTPPDKVITVMNAVHPQDFKVADDLCDSKRKEMKLNRDDLVVGTVARFDPDKALDILIEAISLVAQKIPNVRLLFVGDGPLRGFLEEIVLKRNMSERVIFAGARSDVAELLSIMDVYVNSSIREGIPVSLLEAMAAEKAVVVTSVGGNPEVVNDNSIGIVVPSNQAGALADAITGLLENRKFRAELASAAKERIETTFSVKSQAQKIESIYATLLSKKCIISN